MFSFFSEKQGFRWVGGVPIIPDYIKPVGNQINWVPQIVLILDTCAGNQLS